MPFAKTSQGKIYYEISGPENCPPVVLLRGLGCWTEHWVGWHEGLSKTLRVIIVDNRGLGKSTVPIYPWNSMSDLARDILAVLKTERIARAHIVGTSLGGMIALQFGIDFPDSALSLTAINSSVGGSGHLRLTVPAIKILTTAPVSGGVSYARLAELLTAPSSPPEVRKKISKEWHDIEKRHRQPIRAVTCQLALAMRWSAWKDFSKLKMPVHIIASSDDQFVPRGNSLFIAEKTPHAKLTTINHSGHEPHIDQPEELMRVMTQFFKTIDHQK